VLLLVNLGSWQYRHLAFNNEIRNHRKDGYGAERNAEAARNPELEVARPGRTGVPEGPAARQRLRSEFSKGRDKRPELVLIYDNQRPRSFLLPWRPSESALTMSAGREDPEGIVNSLQRVGCYF
jgi:hypothetical protein